MTIYDNDVEFLKTVVLDSAKLITQDFEVNAKDEYGDLITDFDYEIEKFIIDRIKQVYPNFDIVSEEFNAKKTPTANCFIIDPIDGTVNFASGLPLWGIQVAIMKDSQLQGAVIYLPRLNELYCADSKGAYLNDEKIHCKKNELKRVVYSVGGKNRLRNAIRMKTVAPHCRTIGSAAVNHAWIAKGILGGFVFCGNSCWDYIPGQYIVKQAGGFIYNDEKLHIASSDEQLLEIFKQNCKYDEND